LEARPLDKHSSELSNLKRSKEDLKTELKRMLEDEDHQLLKNDQKKRFGMDKEEISLPHILDMSKSGKSGGF